MKKNSLIDKLNGLDIKIRYVLFAILLIGILIADALTIIPFQWGLLKKTDADNVSLKQNIERLKVEAQRLDQIKSGLKNSKLELEESNKNIQSVSDVPSILENISRLANDSGVKINQLKPQSELQKEIMSVNVIKFYSLPIVVQATCGYHDFGKFLSRLESADFIFTVTHLKIENKGEDLQQRSINATLKVILSGRDTNINKEKDNKNK